MYSYPYPTDMTFAPLTFFIDTLTKAAPLSTGLRRVTEGAIIYATSNRRSTAKATKQSDQHPKSIVLSGERTLSLTFSDSRLKKWRRRLKKCQ